MFVRPVATIGGFSRRVIETEFVQGTIVGGATGIVRVGTSFARAIQTGYLRAYALLLLLGVAALTLYFLIYELVTIHLSIVLFLPLASGLVGGAAAAPPRRAGRCWPARSRCSPTWS